MYLVIGASSFIGRHLYEYCQKNKLEVVGTFFKHSFNSEWVRFDICKDRLDEFCHVNLGGRVPDAVIICSANASIDGCKKDACASEELNVDGIQRILHQANVLGAKSVFLSSEAVFDGKIGMYSEDDIPNPVTLYGRQKLYIEQYMIHNLQKYLIFRISRAVGSQFEEEDIWNEFYNKIKNQGEIICLKNQSFCPTEVMDIAEGIIKSLEQGLNGLFHLSSANYISRYKLAKLYVMKTIGKYDKIVEKEYDEFSFFDNRHIYGGLNGNKLADILGFHYMSVEEILDKYANTWKASCICLSDGRRN